MPSAIRDSRCQIVRTLDIVGEKWSLLIIRNALRGQTTYSQFRDQLGVPSDILAARLVTLVERGIFEKRAYRDAGNRERFSYHLTEAGRGLNLVMGAINQWGEASIFIDADSESRVGIAFVDAAGDRVLSTDVAIIPGPASTTQW